METDNGNPKSQVLLPSTFFIKIIILHNFHFRKVLDVLLIQWSNIICGWLYSCGWQSRVSSCILHSFEYLETMSQIICQSSISLHGVNFSINYWQVIFDNFLYVIHSLNENNLYHRDEINIDNSKYILIINTW